MHDCIALATGMRRGELGALRWKDIDLDGGKLRVEQSLEQMKAGLRFKAPKPKHGRRTITIPPAVVADLRAHWKASQEHRLTLGLGRSSPDDLVFVMCGGSPRKPNALTNDWLRASMVTGRRINLHALRHTHASSLIAAGVDILTISRRLGHANPKITLSVYGHLTAIPTIGRLRQWKRCSLGSGRSKNKLAMLRWQSGGNLRFRAAVADTKSLIIQDGEVAEWLKAAVC
jgi:integrase